MTPDSAAAWKQRLGEHETREKEKELKRQAEEERKAKVADAAADKETEAVDRLIRYAEFGLACSPVPPLPDGATDADRERLQREALDAYYGRGAPPS